MAKVEVEVDIQEVCDSMRYKEQQDFSESILSDASSEALIRELESRGYEIVEN